MNELLFESSPAGQVPVIVGVGEDEFPERVPVPDPRWSRRKRFTVIGSLLATMIGGIGVLAIVVASGAFAGAAGSCGGG